MLRTRKALISLSIFLNNFKVHMINWEKLIKVLAGLAFTVWIIASPYSGWWILVALAILGI